MMRLAHEAGKQSNCIRREVGTVLARDYTALVSSANGVGSFYRDCAHAGCLRCAQGGTVGLGYDQCLCIHAEQQAIAKAARNGISLAGASAFVTLRPCLNCLVLMLHAGIVAVFYDRQWLYATDLERSYESIARCFVTFEHLSCPMNDAAADARSGPE